MFLSFSGSSSLVREGALQTLTDKAPEVRRNQINSVLWEPHLTRTPALGCFLVTRLSPKEPENSVTQNTLLGTRQALHLQLELSICVFTSLKVEVGAACRSAQRSWVFSPPPASPPGSYRRPNLGWQDMRWLIGHQIESFSFALFVCLGLWYWERPCYICEGFHFTEDIRAQWTLAVGLGVSGELIALCFLWSWD